MYKLRVAPVSVGVQPRIMYNWPADPTFRTALRAARRSLLDESLGILGRGAGAAAQALLDEIASADGIDSDRSPSIINASAAVLDRAFRAQDAITLQEEMADLRAELASLKAKQQQGKRYRRCRGPAGQDG